MSQQLIACLPNAASFMESFRSIGYSFETALSDIIDNSISADAKRIDIYLRKNGDVPYIQIIDDGCGMSEKELFEAIRLGGKNPGDVRSENDLGRFGLGLKSASFSQVRKLTVVSKQNGEVHGFQWDLDIVEQTNEFNVKVLREELSEIPNIEELERMETGTIVHWEDFDRITQASHDVFTELSELMNHAIDHIALIFHRFFEGKKLKIYVNNEQVQAKDPFLKNHPGTQELQEKKVWIDDVAIRVHPYVLPHVSRLSASEQRLSGKIEDQYKAQGFYLYRSNRLIVWGDYLGLEKKTELGKNARIQVDIPNSLDYLWEIDVRKSRANVPSKIKRNLLSAIADSKHTSEKVIKYRGKKELEKPQSLWKFYPGREEEGFSFELNVENVLYKEFVETLDKKQARLFHMMKEDLLASVPIQTIYTQIAQGKEQFVPQTDEVLEALKEDLLALKDFGNYQSFLKVLLMTEPYASNESAIKMINEELRR